MKQNRSGLLITCLMLFLSAGCSKTPTATDDTTSTATEDTITLGYFPQTHVNDESIISILETHTETNAKGYYEYNGEQYAKITAFPHDNSYTLSDGTKMTVATHSWFKVEPLVWKLLDSKSGLYVTEKLLTTITYSHYSSLDERVVNGKTTSANNYEYSNMRAWLNGLDGTAYTVDNYTGTGFIDVAFTDEEKEQIKTTDVDNSLKSTGDESNDWVCSNTKDKVFALSAEEASTYWSEDSQRISKPTDYALATGAYMENGNSWCYLRSPFYTSDGAKKIEIDGTVGWGAVYVSCIGVRPAITLK